LKRKSYFCCDNRPRSRPGLRQQQYALPRKEKPDANERSLYIF
jgi:hypothetical protein